MRQLLQRYRDMTPPQPDQSVTPAPGGGGAPAFLRFLSTELRPYISSRFRTQPVTILAGHSRTGFFAAWAFGQAPEFLNGAIALSPTPFAPQQVIDGFTARTAPGRLFLLNGIPEVSLDPATQSLAAALAARSSPSRVVEHVRLAETSHYKTNSFGMMPALQFIFRSVSLGGYQLEFSDHDTLMPKFTAVFDSTREAYLRGARQLGLPQRLPLAFLLGQSEWYQNVNTAPLLLRLCEELITSYAALWHGYDCAADAQGRLGRAGESAENYRRAIEAARGAGDSAAADQITRKLSGDRGAGAR